jgi:hypothetical protein
LTDGEQQAVVVALRRRGLVERKEVDGRRHLRVDLDAVDKLLAGVN